MPFIDESERPYFDQRLEPLMTSLKHRDWTDGELNYVLTRIAHAWAMSFSGQMSYELGSDVIKAFECAKLEYYRSVLGPYEDTKRAKNGDVYV